MSLPENHHFMFYQSIGQFNHAKNKEIMLLTGSRTSQGPRKSLKCWAATEIDSDLVRK